MLFYDNVKIHNDLTLSIIYTHSANRLKYVFLLYLNHVIDCSFEKEVEDNYIGFQLVVFTIEDEKFNLH